MMKILASVVATGALVGGAAFTSYQQQQKELHAAQARLAVTEEHLAKISTDGRGVVNACSVLERDLAAYGCSMCSKQKPQQQEPRHVPVHTR